MARKKTRKQKKRSAWRRQSEKGAKQNQRAGSSLNYTLDPSLIEISESEEKSELESKAEFDSSLFDYDPRLLVGDIKRTVVLSLLVFAIQVALYYYLK